ncbi:hypothetical protein HO133_009908 [Letharia lupina]|uniref:Peptidase S8/S53 domain-containing protein n=1 Tax=Letharia lupina TaxID=560253 RepID=A0A8H6FF00_9LECA|nr:uncharacterized protein HO133_009908 [Letharia lupina]KAF6225905.1 hypothetical protein HO133_009908 [Letharia lupina]
MPITTTITSPPSAYFTSTASNSDWTTDTTTLIDGTIRPVLVGCKVCGGLHHGIVIAGLGGAQADPRRTGCGSGSIFGSVFGCGSEFDFAPLPPFIIGLDGIPTEESADGEGGDSKVCEDDNICSLPTSEEKKSQEPTTLTIMPTSISSLGSSTISDTTPSTSGGSSREYMIFPTAGITSSELTALTEYFTDELGAGNVLPISLNDAGDQVMYVAYSSEIFASDLQTLNPKVESVVADVAQTIWDDPPAGTLLSSLHRRAGNRDQGIFEHDLAKREEVDGKQESAPPELRFVSQPKGVGLDLRGDEDDLGGNVVPYYAYSSAAGEGVTVYVIDSGTNPSNPEYIGMLGTKRWLEIDEEYWLKHASVPSTETDEQNHGSCVLSKLLAKPTEWPRSVIAAMKTAVESLLNDDVVVVTTSGNDKIGTRKQGAKFLQLNNAEVSKYPALFADTLTGLIVVGAVYTDGTATGFSQGGPLVTVCAPAAVKAGTRVTGITCADSLTTGKDYRVGTSFAAPQVAGLAAYFMSTVPSLLVPGQVGQNVKDYIVSKVYSRNRGPLAVFNDFDFRTGAACAIAARKARNKREVTSSLDACLQSYPPTASTYQAEKPQTPASATSSRAWLGLVSVVPDVISTITRSAITDTSSLTPSGASDISNEVFTIGTYTQPLCKS